MKISVKNFRVFKDLTEFEIRPITVLVGPNNSGKSSFTKLLLLLKNGFIPSLNFKDGDHHLESMKKSMNWDSMSKKLLIRNKKAYSMMQGSFLEEIIYDEKGKLLEMSIFQINLKKRKLIFRMTPSEDPSFVIGTQDYNYILDMKYFINLFYKKQIKVPFQDTLNDLYKQELFEVLNKRDFNEKSFPFFVDGIFLSNYKKFIKEKNLTKRSFGINSVIIGSILNNELNKMNEDFLFYDLFFDEENVTHLPEIKSRLLEIQYEEFQSFYPLGFFTSKFDKNYLVENFNKLKEYFNRKNRNIKNNIRDYFEIYEDKKIRVEENMLGRLFFKEKFFLSPHHSSSSDLLLLTNNISFELSFFEAFIEEIFSDFQILNNAIYIPANRGHQERLLFPSKNIEKYDKVVEFINKTEDTDKYFSEEANKLIIEIFKILEIEGEIQPKIIENSAVAIYIKKGNKAVNLADFGFGYSQLIPIILTVYNEMVKDLKNIVNQIFIIEEPEANLHPALQSKLADIFHLILKYNPNWRLIIETHSEYLIRKLQYLVAKKELNTKDCVIHYFNSDENVSKDEPKVKKIEINEEGNLTENFGPGFYDEATRLQFELLKLNTVQKN